MRKSGKVSLWLGMFENRDDFSNYIKVSYDENGNYIYSRFQTDYAIRNYDLDKMESDWIEDRCNDIRVLLTGFSYDDVIISQFYEILKGRDVKKYNSIILLYDFEYVRNDLKGTEMEYIGCAELYCDEGI